MMLMIGDRVKIKNSKVKGTIISIEKIFQDSIVGVKLDKKSDIGSSLHGKCEDGYGLRFRESELQFLTEEEDLIPEPEQEKVVSNNAGTYYYVDGSVWSNSSTTWYFTDIRTTGGR